jgi:multidrug efflux system membrane fusion protein
MQSGRFLTHQEQTLFGSLMRKRIKVSALGLRPVTLGLAALLCAALGLAGCGAKQDASAAQAAGKQDAPAAGPQMPPSLVTVARAIARDVPVYLDEIGKSQALETVTVTPQVAGRITERLFQDGAQIKKDQPLFTIDPRPYQAQLDAAEAQLAQSRAALDLANTQLKMYASIADTKAVSQLDYETKKNNVALGQAQVQAAEAAVENAKLNLEYCHIRSPLDGRAGARLVDVGNVVQTNTTGLLSIQRIDPIYVTFTITESDLPEVRRQMASGTLRVLVRVPSESDSGARQGQLEFLDSSVQNGTGTINLRATVPNPDAHFWPGQFVNVRLILATAKGAVLVPNQATQLSQQGEFVYVIKQDDTAELRPVTLGQRQGDNVVVTKGLADGERVVVTGQLTVSPGAKVRLQQGASGQGAPGQGAAPAGAARGGRS